MPAHTASEILLHPVKLVHSCERHVEFRHPRCKEEGGDRRLFRLTCLSIGRTIPLEKGQPPSHGIATSWGAGSRWGTSWSQSLQ